MREFISRLSSRKFLLAATAAVSLASSKAYGEAVAVVVAYLTAEGVVDVTTARDVAATIRAEAEAGEARLRDETSA